jgi:hypothetical protein
MFVILSTVEHFSLFSSDIYSVYVLPFFYSIYPLSLFPDDAQYVITFENMFVSSFYTSTHLKFCVLLPMVRFSVHFRTRHLKEGRNELHGNIWLGFCKSIWFYTRNIATFSGVLNKILPKKIPKPFLKSFTPVLWQLTDRIRIETQIRIYCALWRGLQIPTFQRTVMSSKHRDL